MKLSPDQLHTLKYAAEHHRSSALIYGMDAEMQRKAWKTECDVARETGGYVFTQDEWLIDVAAMVDAIQPSAPIYLLADAIDVDSIWENAVVDDEPRIVLWHNLIAFMGGGSCLTYLAGTTKYLSQGTLVASGRLEMPDGESGPFWPYASLGMLAAAQQPATPRKLGTNERYALSKARYKPRRDFYYVPHVRYEAGPKRDPKGGHHSPKVSHDRSAHKALLTRVMVEAEEAADLTKRGYTLAWTENLPPEIVAGMTRRGKAPTPGTLNAYQWIDKRATRVNPDGEQAQRVTVVRQ